MCRRSLGFSCSCAEPRRAVQQFCAVGGRPSWAPARSAAGLRASSPTPARWRAAGATQDKGLQGSGKGKRRRAEQGSATEWTHVAEKYGAPSVTALLLETWGHGLGTAAAEQRCQCPWPPGDSTGGCPLATTVQGRREGEICPLPSSFRCMTQELPCWSHCFQFKCWRNMLRG